MYSNGHAQWPQSRQTFLANFSSLLTISCQQANCLDAYLLPRSVHTALSAGLVPLRSLPVTQPWTSPSTAWLNSPHTVMSNPWSCGVAVDTLLYMCLHTTFIHTVVWQWFAAWLASMSVLCFRTDQIASLMAWNDDIGWNFFLCCSKTTSFKTTITCFHQITFMFKHNFVPFTAQSV